MTFKNVESFGICNHDCGQSDAEDALKRLIDQSG